jgi:hypothetical protein
VSYFSTLVTLNCVTIKTGNSSMAKARSWYVKSKKFEMLIKGGNSGLRMIERSKKQQGSIFIRRDEISWMVGAVEEALDEDTSEVFWDPSSAGFPRLLVQNRSNRYGRFLFIEEYEGRKRRGSVLIPEGRFGQGWTRLVSEMRIARSALWMGCDFRASKAAQVVPGRSFAEVVGRSRTLESEMKVVPAVTVEGTTASGAHVQAHHQTRPVFSPAMLDTQIGRTKASKEAGDCVGDAPVTTQLQAKENGMMGNGNMASILPNALQNPGKSGMEAPIGGWLSDGKGRASVHAELNLQVLKKCLSDIRGELVSGLKRVESIFQMLEVKELVGREVCQGNFMAACSFRNVDDGMEWAFAGVYGPNRDALRRQLWEELTGLMCIWELPWCIGGDFDVTLFHNERSGGVRRRRAVAAFADFIAELGLMDLPLAGGVSTWANNDSWSRLDRFLVSPDWELKYPGLMQKKLLRVCSDHAPIILMRGCVQNGKSAFKFENMWLKEEGFVDKVNSWWSSLSFMGSPSFILDKKLSALKGEIKRWNREVFGNVGVRNKAWAEELESLDRIEEVRRLSEEEKERRRVLVSDLEASLLQEEISWIQKSRVRWLKEGDKCTKFFHQLASANRRNNTIESLIVDGSPTSDLDSIGEHVVNYYESLFSEPLSWRPRLDNLEFDRLNGEEASSLEDPFEEREVKEVIKGMDRDKAPGPDGFSMAFFQDCWEVIKGDFMAVFEEFHARGKFVKSINSTFISLIPKVQGAKEVKDFRPISLVGGVYKIISKVLANRMRKVMDKIISKPQNAFVKGRQILDSVLIANECLDSRIKSEEPGVLCKLDMEKAYDHVDWSFLLYLLRRCGFGEKWCSWIQHCISSVRFSVLINGVPSGFFGCSRGVRQGDPLSPFLFVLVMEAFSRMLGAFTERGLISGFSVGSSGQDRVNVYHLLFADDTLVFCGANTSQIRHLGALLVCFEAVAGLKVNLSKSILIPVGHVENVGQLAGLLGCGFGEVPLKYLGLPLGASFKLKSMWVGLEDMMLRRLAPWKRLYLSKGGRVTLIKSTLSNMPTYMLSLFPIPIAVAKRLEKIQRDFLWGGMNDDFKYHLVEWDKVCTPIDEGGLGIRNIRRFNQALLGKWLWRFAHEEGAWWRSVLVAKYGSDWGGWRSGVISGSHGVGLWKFICMGWQNFRRFC